MYGSSLKSLSKTTAKNRTIFIWYGMVDITAKYGARFPTDVENVGRYAGKACGIKVRAVPCSPSGD